ncbi:UNVERIFIED_CONTAM: hypothetical protein FKN15_048246 [Acipenser sinensis]
MRQECDLQPCAPWRLTQPCDAQEVLGALPHRLGQGQVHKGFHIEPVHQAEPEVILRLDRVRGHGV